MKLFATVAVALAAACLTLPASSQDEAPSPLARLWPAGVRMPEGLTPYDRTEYTQRVAITNGRPSNYAYKLDRDDHWTNDYAANPNRLFPWKANGGLHGAEGWSSHVAVSFPRGTWVWYWHGHTPNGQRLPKIRWTFPYGTVFVDLLAKGGKAFEVRTLTRKEDGWHGHTVWESEDKPQGYVNPHKVKIDDAPHVRKAGVKDNPSRKCLNCHDHAGSSLQYGISLRGDSGIFSWSPFVEGTVEINQELVRLGILRRWKGE